MGRDPGPAAGVGRAALLVAGAVMAAALVLAAGALRSGPAASAPPSPGASSAASSPDLPSLPPAPTAAATLESTPALPEPTEIADLRGEFVGALGQIETCPILYQRDGVLELILPDGHRSRIRGGEIQILRPNGSVAASEGDLLGLDGKVRNGGGSFCMAGPQLHVTRIVEVVSRGGS